MPHEHKRRRIALVTGASSGIGAEFARQLAARRYSLVLTARREDRLRSLAVKLRLAHDARSIVVTADLSTREGREQLVRELDRRHIVPDLFVNNAGFGHHGDVDAMPVETIESMVALNVTAATVLAREIAARMRRRRSGAIVNVASLAGFQPCPHVAVYGATKAYLLMLSQSMTEELRRSHVRVMALCPGMTHSEFHEKAGPPYRIQNPAMFVPAEVCVRRCLESLDRGRNLHIDGWKNRLVAEIQRLLPRSVILRVSGWAMTLQKGGKHGPHPATNAPAHDDPAPAVHPRQ